MAPFQIQPGTYYKIADLAKAGVAGAAAIRRWIKSGDLKAARVGRDYVITGEEIQSFLARGSSAKTNSKKKATDDTAKKQQG
jgi:hypothetical protein